MGPRIPDPKSVPSLLVGIAFLRRALPDMRVRWVLPFIDGARSIEDLSHVSGLPSRETLHAIRVLLDYGVLAIEPRDAHAPSLPPLEVVSRP
jgi:hypothetical protein